MFLALLMTCKHVSRLPEIPPDTPETNSVMRVSEYPEFSSITPQQIVTGCAKLAIEFDVQLGKHAENLKGIYIYCYFIMLTSDGF